MTTLKLNKLTFLSLLWTTMFLTSCNGQVKKSSPEENETISDGQLEISGSAHETRADADLMGKLLPVFRNRSDRIVRYAHYLMLVSVSPVKDKAKLN